MDLSDPRQQTMFIEGVRNRLLQLEWVSEEMDHLKKTFLPLAETSPRPPEDPDLQIG